ncbi:hypothetical protein V1294_006891 [Bradyrhizobium sp. AZCC 1678]|uniref:caspase family protein n=1 Tax=Bradyrhizobium sp. AZCC 1678 TaxID=3117030 RepID=UPI002FF37354
MRGDWAIIVGVKDYLDPSLNTLEGPISDAQSFFNWLVRPEGGDICDPARIKLVKSLGRPTTPSKAKPTGDDIYAAGEDIISSLDGQDERGRRLYIYMSGHGCTPINAEQAESVALLMANARTTGTLFNFPATACAKFMRRGGYFDEVILIMDCCRSQAQNALSFPYYAILGDTTQGGTLVEAYATSWDSQAHEFSYPPSNSKRGAFTRAIITCLEAGKITGHQLKESVEHLVEKDLLSKGFPKEAVGKRQPVVRGDPDLTRIWFSEGAPLARTQIRISRQAGMPAPKIYRLAEFPAPLVQKQAGDDPDPWCWLLEPGDYGLKIGDTSRTFRVHVGSPEELLP